MIRKVINEDGTFGANFDEELEQDYRKAGLWVESSYIELTLEQALKIDKDIDRYVYKAGVPGMFLGHPMGVVEREDIAQYDLEKARLNKYAEITNLYDYANQYYVFNLYDNMYGNVSWINTWTKVINLCETMKQTTIPSAVRYYSKKAGESKFSNVTVENVTLADLKRQKQLLESVQFNVLQPKRDNFYKQLNEAKTVSEVNSIKVYYGFTINEQDPLDTSEKINI